MTALVVAPILVPAVAAALSLVLAGWSRRWERAVSAAGVALLPPIAIALVAQADLVGPVVVRLGDWPARYGIVLVLDRLSALLLVVSAIVAPAALFHALGTDDRQGRYFHTLFQLQLLGVHGACLTGDLFNLFVFYELMLTASYALLLYGAGVGRLRAGLIYVCYNLIGSLVFLVAVALVYGTHGTLNLADLAVAISRSGPADVVPVRIAGMLLLVALGIKSALVPLHFWLPRSYAAAAAPVAALFGLLSKVGAYSIVRIFTLLFGDLVPEGPLAGVGAGWVLPAALLTLAVGMLGTVASRTPAELACFLLVASMGTLLTGIGLFDAEGISAGLYYLAHSATVSAGLFLLVGAISAFPAGRTAPAAMLFLASTLALVGLPPVSGFIGKLAILESASSREDFPWIWAVVLASAFVGLGGCARTGMRMFWTPRASSERPASERANRGRLAPAGVLIGVTVPLTVFAGPVLEFTRRTADQLLDPGSYVEAVLDGREVAAASNAGAGGAP